MLASLVLAAAVGSPTDPPTAGPPRYYFTLFGGQSVPFKPRTAHTWATFAKATPTADGAVAVEVFTISWLPVSGEVHPWRLRPTEGKNFTLQETFDLGAPLNTQVSRWGPYEIDTDRYERAAAQARLLESGAVQFRTLDNLGFNHSVLHCVHAVTYADPVLRRRIQPVLQVGEPGTSRLAAKYLRTGAFIGGAVTHEWLVPFIGADTYPVIRREPGEHVARRWR